jgi:hypothetical protein
METVENGKIGHGKYQLGHGKYQFGNLTISLLDLLTLLLVICVMDKPRGEIYIYLMKTHPVCARYVGFCD